MKLLDDFSAWLAENMLGEVLQSIFADHLALLGLSALFTTGIAILLSIAAVRMVRGLLAPPPEINWADLDPDDNLAMRQAFEDLHIVVISRCVGSRR